MKHPITLYKKRLTILLVTLCALSWSWAGEIDLIPKPLRIEQSEGHFRLTSKATIGYDTALQEQAEYQQQLLGQSTGWDLALKPEARKATIRLELKPGEVGHPEGYRLEVTPKGVTVTGEDQGGVFYGIQTLLQLFPAEVYSDRRQHDIEWTAPAVTIYDAPNRPWRGMMLDVARYFYHKEFVKKYIDMMAMYKLNKLQLHLIDDSGWRLEIKKYPRLTDVGAWAGHDARRLGGYYTQEDIKELIAYARVRNVEIIPEIEFPAHILSAIVAYPWLSCTGLQHEVPLQHFISKDLLCVGKESSIQFLSDILDETVALFPSAYINIGGDEAVYTRWESCPHCQAVVKREGLKDASELQGYLTNVVAEMMKKKGRTVVGWEEILLRGEVKTPVVGVFWHNVADTIEATRTGHKAILTPATHMYFDFPESQTPGEVKAATWMPPISVEKCYGMEINDYSPQSTVLGVQGCFWSDQFIHGTTLQEIDCLDENRSENYAEYLTFPRLLALSEVAWAPQATRNYRDFAQRLSHHFARLDFKDCHYRVPEPHIEKMATTPDGKLEFTLSPTVDRSLIRYTTDGSYPTTHSPIYTGPVTVADKSDFKAITVVTDTHYSLPIYFAPDYSAYKSYGEFTTEWKPLVVQTQKAPWRFECTGKIAGNGHYAISFIPTKGANPLRLGSLKLYKRDELLAEVAQPSTTDGQATTYRFTVDTFEAGTPFFVEVEAYGEGGNDTSGLVFILKEQ
ncbi:MAG TPA: family 20 glycosylhydrolase [Candidatus Barnesiella merdipullorum]|nr:family 20 glycosylhydrolase [Candidatus Barnesiella merdipullorum]